METSSRFMNNKWGCDFFTPHGASSLYFIVWLLTLIIHDLWRRQWHPTPVLLPGKPHGRRSLVGCSPWCRWVGRDWATSFSLFTFMHWRRKWQPPPMFLPGESQGRRSLVGCRLWGRTELDTTEATQQRQQQQRRQRQHTLSWFNGYFTAHK